MRLIFTTMFFMLISISMTAQPPQGGGSGGFQGGDRMRQSSMRSSEKILVLANFPEIPEITLKQREKVGTILTKEKKDIDKQLAKKKKIEEKSKDADEKDLLKNEKKTAEIDKKIEGIKEQSNIKIAKEFTKEQFDIFVEKRDEVRFEYLENSDFEGPRGGGDSFQGEPFGDGGFGGGFD